MYSAGILLLLSLLSLEFDGGKCQLYSYSSGAYNTPRPSTNSYQTPSSRNYYSNFQTPSYYNYYSNYQTPSNNNNYYGNYRTPSYYNYYSNYQTPSNNYNYYGNYQTPSYNNYYSNYQTPSNYYNYYSNYQTSSNNNYYSNYQTASYYNYYSTYQTPSYYNYYSGYNPSYSSSQYTPSPNYYTSSWYNSGYYSSSPSLYSECGQQQFRVDKQGGAFSSPNYPNSYQPNLNCKYIFVPSECGKQIIFEVMDFQVEDSYFCSYDYLTLDDIHSNGSQLSVNGSTTSTRICNTQLQQRGTTFSVVQQSQSLPIVVLKFISDGSVQGRGFRLRYRLA